MSKSKRNVKAGDRAPTGGNKPASASALQARLERLDETLVRLINERASLTLKLAQLSRAASPAETLPPACEAWESATQVLARAAASSPLPSTALQAVFRELLSACRALVRQTSVAFLGPLYSYSHLAAIHRFGQSVRFIPVGTIAAVFEEVHRGHSDFGLVPLENSTDGRVADTLDMFARMPVRICGEVELAIHHALLARCARSEIKEVYSRPQALSQCRNWLARHLPAARAIEVTSTSTAAQLACEKPGAAAIASVQAGIHYGLSVLADQIEDNPGNTTRFAVIGGQEAPRTGHDKTALMFQVEHRPGGLADAINVFKRNRLNMTWIESFPVPGTKGAYLFFVELEGHQSDMRVRRALRSLREKTLRLEILGSYAAAEPV